MNVVMPTAMQSVHKDAELKECASKTASSGKKILRLLKGSDDVTSNCKAILRVCQGVDELSKEERTDDLVEVSLWCTALHEILIHCCTSFRQIGVFSIFQFWEKFFVNYKYEEQQKNDIALAVSEFCSGEGD